MAKDYLLFPALALWNAPRVVAGNLLANTARNLCSSRASSGGSSAPDVTASPEVYAAAERGGADSARAL
ncbi:MAG TPA: hypothetical protein VFP65_18510 [Anaeromyxobacteraceae bacterium]|nr:hypothetical protein [Anaeromyxobacteraceae bacterium]